MSMCILYDGDKEWEWGRMADWRREGGRRRREGGGEVVEELGLREKERGSEG